MALGREIHDDIRLKPRQRAAHRRRIADVGLHEAEARMVGVTREIGAIAGIGQLVDDKRRMARLFNNAANHGRTDEAGSAGDENATRLFHRYPCPTAGDGCSYLIQARKTRRETRLTPAVCVSALDAAVLVG